MFFFSMQMFTIFIWSQKKKLNIKYFLIVWKELPSGCIRFSVKLLPKTGFNDRKLWAINEEIKKHIQ